MLIITNFLVAPLEIDMTLKSIAPIIATGTLAALLLGCERAPAGGAVDPRSLMPNDAPLAQLYQRSCFACHATAASNAPLTGDTAAWAARLKQGPELLLDHVINGYRGMPPLGLCMDCDADQFEALIAFMSGTNTAVKNLQLDHPKQDSLPEGSTP